MIDPLFGKKKSIFDKLDESTNIEDKKETRDIDDVMKEYGLDILNEAPDDTGDAGGGEASATDTGNDQAGGDIATDDTGNNDTGGEAEDDMGSDEDFDIDTGMDDGGGDAGGDDAGSDDTGGGLDSGGGGLDGDSEEEVNPKNTDIFSTLTKEEQAIKIRELKNLFNKLYTYTNDMINKLDDVNPSEDNTESLYRVSSGLYNLKASLAEYIKYVFSIKSYIENVVAYNRYLTILQSITGVINTLADELQEITQKDEKNK